MQSTITIRQLIGTTVLAVTVFISVIGQIEPIREIMRPVMLAMWGGTILILGLFNFKMIKISKFTGYFFLIYLIYFLFCFTLSFYNDSFLESNFLMVLLPPLLVTVVADFYRSIATYKLLKMISLVFIGAAFIYALWVQFTFFPTLGGWYATQKYAFVSKNSGAQIWSCGIFLIAFFLNVKARWLRYFLWGIAGYLAFVCLLSQCRTAVLGMSCIFGWYFFRNKSKSLVFYSSMIFLVAIVLLEWDFFSAFLEKAIFLGDQDNLDANRLSSGRLGLYEEALNYILSSPIVGNGKYYVDNHYLCVFTESGIFGFILIESVWLRRLWTNLKYSSNTQFKVFIISITFFYVVESVFEAFPPFGPGVTAMIFWLYSQLLTGGKIERYNNLKL